VFADKRSKKVVLVSHCILNQNTKLDECAHYPGAIQEVTQLFMDKGIGIIQMPCPEFFRLGLDRQTDSLSNPTVESEDTRIAKIMADQESRQICERMADDVLYQVEEYIKNGFQVIGLLGINGSPTCGIETTWADFQELKGFGAFIKILDSKLTEKGIKLKMKGIKANDPVLALKAANSLIDDL
jgi:predicted secreted protein